MTLARRSVLAASIALVALSAGCAHHRDATASTELRPSETAGFSRIDMRGPVDVLVREGSGPEVDLMLLGHGDVTYTGSADLVRCKIDGSGDVVLRGAGKRLEASLHGAGDLNARDFPVEGGAYEIEGSGDIATVAHGGEMAVHIGGSGDLRYRGDARITSLAVTGDGAVRQLDSSED
jgi:hypothetical protein